MAYDGNVIIGIEGADEDFEKTLSSLGTVTDTAIKGLTTAVTAASAAIAGLGAAAIAVGTEFETSLAGTSTMFGDVEVDTAGLTDQILELSSATGLAATDISGSLYNALSAGIPVTEDMTGAMEYMESCSQLAAAGFTDIDTAVTATAKVMNAYGMELEDVDSIQTIMLQTQNKGITTVDELGASLANVTPTASAMGVSFENVGAALATMTAQGTGTAEATTQLNSLIAELGKSGTTAAGNLEAAAEGTEYAGMSFTDMMDAGVPLNEVLDLMSEYAESGNLSMIDLFSSLEAGKAALAVAGDNSATFADNLSAMSTEADVVGDAYASVTDTLDHQISTLKESVTNLGIAVYDGMANDLKESASLASGWVSQISSAFTDGGLDAAVGTLGDVLAQAVTYAAEQAPAMVDAAFLLIEAFAQGIWDNRDAIAQAVADIVLAVAEGLGDLVPMLSPVTDAIGFLITNFNDFLPVIAGVTAAMVAFKTVMAISSLLDTVTKGIAAFKTANEATTISQALLNAVMNANPLVLIATLVAGVVTALIVLYNTNDDFRAKVDEVWAAVTATISAAISAVVNFFTKTLPDAVETALNWFDRLPDEFMSIGKNIVTGLWDGIAAMGSWITGKVSDFFGGIINSVTDIFDINSPSKVFADIGGYTIEGFAQGVEDEASASESDVVGAMEDMSDGMQEALGDDLHLGLEAELTSSVDSAMEELGKKLESAVAMETARVSMVSEAEETARAVTATVTGETVAQATGTGQGGTTAVDVGIEFTGSLSQLARVLLPYIKKEERRSGE